MRFVIPLVCLIVAGGCKSGTPSARSTVTAESTASIDAKGYIHHSYSAAHIIVAFVPGSGRLSREELDAAGFPGEPNLFFRVTIEPGQKFADIFSLAGIDGDIYESAAPPGFPDQRLVGSVQIVRKQPASEKREVVSFYSHGFRLGGAVLGDGDYVIARTVTGY